MRVGDGIFWGGMILAVGTAIFGISSCSETEAIENTKKNKYNASRYERMLNDNPDCYVLQAGGQADQYFLQCKGDRIIVAKLPA